VTSQVALVLLQQGEQLTENARDVAPVDFIHQQEELLFLRRVARCVAKCLEDTRATHKDELPRRVLLRASFTCSPAAMEDKSSGGK